MTPPNEHTSEGGRDDRGVPYHAESTLSTVLKCSSKGVDRELRKSEDATHFATDGPAPRRYDGRTTAGRVRAAVFVRSEYSNALVGGGFPQPAPRSGNLDSAFGGMQLFATEA